MQYLIHMDFVNDDWVVMVERTKLAMMESLPMAMQQKKFGTWGKCSIFCVLWISKLHFLKIEENHAVLSKNNWDLFDHEETCIDLCTMQHVLYWRSPSDRWDYVLFVYVTIFILVIMNAHTYISYVRVSTISCTYWSFSRNLCDYPIMDYWAIKLESRGVFFLVWFI